MEFLSFHTSSVLSWLIESTIFTSILICLIILIKKIMGGKMPAWWTYGLWILLLIRMFIPLSIKNQLSVYNYVPSPPVNDSYLQFLSEQKFNFPYLQANDQENTLFAEFSKDELIKTKPGKNNELDNTKKSGINFSLDRILLAIWITGALFFIIITLFKNIKFWLAVRRELPVKKDSDP